MKIRKNLEKGSATMIVIFVIFFIVIILSTFLVYVTSKRNNQLKETEKLSEIYNGDIQEIYEERKNRESRIEVEIKKCHGPNEPDLKVGMTPVKFNEATISKKGEIVKTTKEDKDWYSYKDKRWANAETQDGSLWVWIPRFAYKINSDTQTTDVVFLKGTTDEYCDENGNIQIAKRCRSKEEKVDTEAGYTLHPAFTDESSIGFRNGGWDKELAGIWVSKFEAAYATSGEVPNKAPVKESSVVYTTETVVAYLMEVQGVNSEAMDDASIPARNWLDGVYEANKEKIKYPTFQGSSYSMNYISINDSNNISRVLTEPGNIYGLSLDTDSHLMKNSEWGACTYLARDSKYGIGNKEIAVNNKNLNNGGVSTTKEQGNKLASVYAVTGYNANNNEWNDYLGNNLSSSTTGNIYGIYDMSGGLWERNASYINNGNQYLEKYGASVVIGKDKSTKYATVYPYSDVGADGNEKAATNYKLNDKIYGDSISETSSEGKGNSSWYGSYSYYPEGVSAFFSYGGHCCDGSNAGLSAFYSFYGDAYWRHGYRCILV